MDGQQEKLGTRFRNKSWTRPNANAERMEAAIPGGGTECFGIEQGDRFVRRFKLYSRNGTVTSIPYAYLPVIIYDPDHDLKIRTGEVEIRIRGRGLDKLADHFNEEKVLWVRESASAIDTGDNGVFVESISMEGELFV